MSNFKALVPSLVLSLVAATAAPLVADQHASCDDPGIKRIRVLGLSPISKARIDDREELARYLESIRPAINAIMTRKGLADRTDDLLHALRTGEGVSEGQLEPGDIVEWMIFRQEGYIAVGKGPYCVDTARAYEAFEVKLVDEEDLGTAVRTSTSRFLIPKICANLGYLGTKTETVEKPRPPAPPPTPTPPPPVEPPTPVPPPKPPPPAPVPEPEPKKSRWTARGFGLRMDVDDHHFSSEEPTPTGALSVGGGAQERTEISVGGGNGVGFNVEYRHSDRFGIEGGLLYSELESMLVLDTPTEWLMDKDSSSMVVLTFGPNFHLTPNAKADFYVGPFIGLAQLSDPSYNLGGTVGTVRGNYDDEFVFGAQAGLDVPFGGSGWAFHLGALYMNLGVGEGGVDLDLNPLTGTIGLAYDF